MEHSAKSSGFLIRSKELSALKFATDILFPPSLHKRQALNVKCFELYCAAHSRKLALLLRGGIAFPSNGFPRAQSKATPTTSYLSRLSRTLYNQTLRHPTGGSFCCYGVTSYAGPGPAEPLRASRKQQLLLHQKKVKPF